YSFVKYRGSDFNNSNLWEVRFDSASGTIFEALATIGVLGTFCLIAIGLIFLSIAFIALSRSENKEIKVFLLGAFSSLIVLVVNACLFTVSGSIILIIVALGSLTAALIVVDYPEKFKEIKLSFRSSPKYALALAALFLLVSAGVVVLFTSGFKIYLADFYASKALNAGTDYQAAVNDLNRAIATADYQDEYYLRLSRLYINMANQEAQKGGSADINAIQNYLSSAILAGKKAVDLSPNSVANKESLALIYENAAAYNITGALEWAEKLYTEVTQLEPDSPSAYVRLALINMAHANNEKADEEKKHFYNEALKFYSQAIAKKPNLAAAYYGAAVAQEKLNDYSKAIEELGKAVTLAGDNLDYRFELGRMYFNRGVQNQNLQQEQTKAITAAEDKDQSAIANEQLSVSQEQQSKVIALNDDLKTAEAIFKNIIEASPNHANAIYSLALIYETVGDKAQARTNYEKLLNIVEDQATKDAILKKLQTL
ncbi:MAG: tetratricopeptide repeat protein, partial [Patescibacteria group bacterium]